MTKDNNKKRKVIFVLFAIILIFSMFKAYQYVINASGYNENEGFTLFGYKAYDRDPLISWKKKKKKVILLL